MCLHDMGTSSIVALDPIHQLTWCLNAAAREKVIEGEYFLSNFVCVSYHLVFSEGRLMNEFSTQYVQLKESVDIIPEVLYCNIYRTEFSYLEYLEWRSIASGHCSTSRSFYGFCSSFCYECFVAFH